MVKIRVCVFNSTINCIHFNFKRTLFNPPRVHGAHEYSADSDPVIMPYKVVNEQFISLHGIITGSQSAKFSCARYNGPVGCNG